MACGLYLGSVRKNVQYTKRKKGKTAIDPVSSFASLFFSRQRQQQQKLQASAAGVQQQQATAVAHATNSTGLPTNTRRNACPGGSLPAQPPSACFGPGTQIAGLTLRSHSVIKLISKKQRTDLSETLERKQNSPHRQPAPSRHRGPPRSSPRKCLAVPGSRPWSPRLLPLRLNEVSSGHYLISYARARASA